LEGVVPEEAKDTERLGCTATEKTTRGQRMVMVEMDLKRRKKRGNQDRSSKKDGKKK